MTEFERNKNLADLFIGRLYIKIKHDFDKCRWKIAEDYSAFESQVNGAIFLNVKKSKFMGKRDTMYVTSDLQKVKTLFLDREIIPFKK